MRLANRSSSNPPAMLSCKCCFTPESTPWMARRQSALVAAPVLRSFGRATKKGLTLGGRYPLAACTCEGRRLALGSVTASQTMLTCVAARFARGRLSVGTTEWQQLRPCTLTRYLSTSHLSLNSCTAAAGECTWHIWHGQCGQRDRSADGNMRRAMAVQWASA
jgi:hypothetical protein